MNQIQEKLYKLLIEVDAICKKHNIVYYLAAGGALGAIRNGGFLPWDDDIDLYITRDNWEKLRSVIKEELPANREFVCTEETELYCNPIGRYVDKETTLMMKSQLLCGKCCGLLVEFFIMDPMPTGEQEKWEHRRYMKAYTEVLSPYFVVNKEIFEHNIDFDYKLYNKYYWLSKLIGTQRTLNLLMNKFARFPEDACQEFCMRWGQRTVIFPKAMFGEAKHVKFEDREFPVVEYPEKTFRVGYGDDWMYVPENDNQISHDLSNDLEEPFESYTNLYMPLLDKKRLMRAFQKRKRLAIKGLQKKEAYERAYAVLCAELYAKTIIKSGCTIDELERLLKNREFGTLNKALHDFYQAQADIRLKANDILIPLPDEYIYIAVMNQILQGYYYRVARIMLYRDKLNKEMPEALRKAKELIEFCRQLSIAIYDDKSVKDVERILEKTTKYQELLDFKRAELWVLYKKAQTQKDFEELVQKAREGIAAYETDGELIRFEAYGLYKLDRREEAEKQYIMAVKNTRNGFVWKEAKELFGIDAYQMDEVQVQPIFADMEEEETDE